MIMKQMKNCDFCGGALDPLDGDYTFAHKGCLDQHHSDRGMEQMLMEELMNEDAQ
jgi:hypothetical protein